MSTSGKIPGIVSKFVFLLRKLALSVTFRSFLTCHSGWIHALSTLSKLYIREQCVCWTLWHLPFGRNSLLFTKWAFAWTYRLMSWKITLWNQVTDHCFKTIYNNLCYTTFSGILPKAKTPSTKRSRGRVTGTFSKEQTLTRVRSPNLALTKANFASKRRTNRTKR